MPTAGQWLDRWLKPQLGHLPLTKLTVDHVAALFDAIAERNDEIETARASDNPGIQASVRGVLLRCT